jgi:uncharacterized protein (DUF433 family)
VLKTTHRHVMFNNEGVLVVADTKTTVLELAFEHMFGATVKDQLRIHPELEKSHLFDALSFYFENEAALSKYIDKRGVLVLSLAMTAVNRIRSINSSWRSDDEWHRAAHSPLPDPTSVGPLLN